MYFWKIAFATIKAMSNHQMCLLSRVAKSLCIYLLCFIVVVFILKLKVLFYGVITQSSICLMTVIVYKPLKNIIGLTCSISLIRLLLLIKLKGKEEYLYSTFIQRLVSRHSEMDHTVLPANYTMPAFPSWAFTRCLLHWMWWRTSNCSSLDSERMKGWVGLVGWPMADGLPTHKWSPISCRSRAGRRKNAVQRLTFYRWARQANHDGCVSHLWLITLPSTCLCSSQRVLVIIVCMKDNSHQQVYHIVPVQLQRWIFAHTGVFFFYLWAWCLASSNQVWNIIQWF